MKDICGEKKNLNSESSQEMPVHLQVEIVDPNNNKLDIEEEVSKFRKLSDFNDPNWEE